jgi:hypothetical protein
MLKSIALLSAIFTVNTHVAAGDIISLHNIVYFDENGLGFALYGDNSLTQAFFDGARTHPSTVTMDGVPTVQYTKDESFIPGDIVLLEDPNDLSQPSDLIRITKTALPKNSFQYSMQFYSDADPDGLKSDASLPSFDYGSNTVICPEQDLTNATKDWRINGKLDPNPKLNLASTVGCTYIAYWHDVNGSPPASPDIGASALSGHDPIGYIFVSDLPATPEPATALLFGAALFGILWLRSGSSPKNTTTRQ